MINNLNKLAILLLFLLTSVNKGYCQNTNYKPFKYKGYIEFGGGRIFKDLKWHLSDFNADSALPLNNSVADRRSFVQCLSFKTINGLYINDKFFVGLSLGLDQMKGKMYQVQFKTYLIPIGIDMRYYFGKGQFRPTFNINSGYAIAISTSKKIPIFYNPIMENIRGGVYLHPSIGLQILTSRYKHRAINLNLGYKVQKINATFSNFYYPTVNNNFSIGNFTCRKLDFLTFTVGCAF